MFPVRRRPLILAFLFTSVAYRFAPTWEWWWWGGGGGEEEEDDDGVCPDLSRFVQHGLCCSICLFFVCLGAPFCPARHQLRSRSQPRSAQVALKTTSSHDDNSPWAGQARCLLRVGLGRGTEERSKKVQNGVTFFRLSNIPDNSRHVSHWVCDAIRSTTHNSWIEIVEAFVKLIALYLCFLSLYFFEMLSASFSREARYNRKLLGKRVQYIPCLAFHQVTFGSSRCCCMFQYVSIQPRKV